MSDESPLPAVVQSTTKPGSGRYAAHVFRVLFVISMLNYLDRNVLAGAANTVAHELGFGLDGIGYIASAFIVVYTICIIPLGLWADHARRKNVVALCVAVWSVATVLTALSFNFVTLFLSRMVLGVGEAGYFPAGTALMGDYFSREKRARIMSWWSIGQLVGILFGFIIGGAVAGLYVGSWRLAFIVTGIPGLILAFLAWRLREPRRNEADEDEPHASPELPDVQEVASLNIVTPGALILRLRDLLRIKTLLVLTIMQIFAYFVLGVTVTFLPIFLQQKDLYGLSSGVAGIFSGAVIVLAGFVGTISGGYLADWLNRRNAGARILVCGIGFLASAPTFALSVTVHSFGLFALFFVLTTIFITFYTGPSTAATQDIAPAALRASAVAITILIAHALGDAFSPTLVGILARLFDPTGGAHFAQNMAGHDLSLAMLVTCTPALIIAGLIGVFGARWMDADLAAAAQADRQLRQIPLPIES